MKKPTIFKVLIAVVFLLLSLSSYSQVREGFKTEYSASLNGDILVIGNNILNRDENKSKQRANDAFDDVTKVNDNFDMKYIDIDGDSNTFNSSSAKLVIPQASQACYEIVYAALYWAGTYQGSDRSKIANVKLKTPTAAYKQLTGTIIYDEGKPGVTNVYASKPYACFKEITDEVKSAKDGVYTVGDIMTSEGKVTPGGNSGGWSIFVVYKDPLLPNKFITSFNGFGIIRASDPPLVIPVSGFRTNPFGDVNAKLAFAALEGDASLKGDGLKIQGVKSATAGNISSLVRPIAPGNPGTPNFFNSTITDGDIILPGRTPASLNTLGYDTGVVKIDNPNNTIIQNNETDANLTINTSQDSYYMFFTALSVEIIAPKIVLRKNALDKNNNNINGKPVTLNQDIQYEINFRNEGNDNAKNFTITDELPKNVIFGGLSGITMDSRITATYDAATRKLVFTIPDAMVVANGPLTPYTIKFKVKVVDDCNELIDACSNKVENIAYSRYFGEKNTTPEGFGEGSYSSISQCNVGEPTATNFLVGIQDCLFNRDVSICGTATLTAALGYKTYVWRDPNGVIFGGNNRTVTIDKPGKYTVNNSGADNCEPIMQTFNVKDYLAGTIANPIKGDNIDPATGLAYACVRDNKPFPKIFLCGLNDKREIDTKITGATKVTWQETKDVPPANQPNPESCPYEGATNWTTIVDNDTKFIADRPGVFRLVVNYGNTCVVMHYFNVYQNKLDPQAEKQDIVCNTKGWIKVTNPPENTGYSYSLDGTSYQTSSTFNNVPKGSYKVQIRQTVLIDGQMSACPFFVDVNVDELVLSADIQATHPICTGELGTITANLNNVPGQYKFVLRKKGSTAEIQNTGLIDDNFTKFKGVEPGVYEVDMSTAKNGCFITKEIEVFDYRLAAEAKVTKNLTACANGEITVTVTGGTPRPGPPPYYMYYVNGNADYFTSPIITVTPEDLPADGIFNIVVVDDKGCSVTIPPIKMIQIVKPTVTFDTKNLACYNSKEGEISMVVTPADSGYSVSYNVNGGAFTTMPTTNLSPGDYKVIVKYTYDGVDCFDPEKTITITGPGSPLTASGGVAELSGCGPAGNEQQGLVRITNPQGGVQFPAPNPYRYSFDGGKTWQTSNQAYVEPSATPYTLLIKDAAGCIFEVKGIVLDPKPAKPTFDVSDAVYNCNGQGTVTVTANVSTSASYTYSYYIGKPDPANPGSYIYALNTNTPANVFKDVPAGDYKIKVEYTLVQAPTFSNLLKEDFGSGPPTTTPGIAPAYCFNDQRVNPPYLCKYPDGTPSRSVEDNAYSVASFFWRPDDPLSNNSGAWFHYKDHTTNPNNLDNVGDPNGRYLLVNVGNAAGKYGVLYSKPIVDVIPNQDVIVDFYVGNLLMPTYNSAAPIIRIELVDGTGKVVARDDTGEIAPGFNHPDRKKWVPISLKLNPGDNKNLTFVVRSGSEVFNGNDLVIDDIWVRQLPKSCLSAETLDLKVENGKGFKAEVKGITGVSCSNSADGGFSIYAENFNTTDGFYYTLNGGDPSPTWVNSKVSPVVISGKNSGVYDVRVRYANDAASCNFTIPTTIPAKDPFVVNAIASAATCKGATVTATAVGGTPAYTLTLKDKNSSYTKTFPADGILYEVPAGTYIISGVDSKSCSDAMDTELVIDPASKPQAVVVQNSGLCFDNNAGAKITVNIIGGVGPFTYKVSTDGGITYGSSSASFTTTSFDYKVTAPGKYSFLITDANSCDALAVSQTIDEQISARSSISGALTCTTGKATIEVTISGGTAPYKYVVKNKATNTVLFTSGDITGPTFTYTDVPGTYVFTITDKNGCTAVEEKEIKPTEPVTAEHKVENVTCYNAANGYVDITPLTGVAPFTYQFNGTGAFGTATHYGPLAGSVAGITYSYIVKDNLGCEQSYTFKVFQPEDLVPSASISTPYTCETTATITASAIGGNGGYNFELKNTTTNTVVGTNTTGLFENLTIPGSYSVTVTDSKNCSKTVVVGTIVAPNPPKGMTINNSAVTCPSNQATVTITNVVDAAGAALPTAGLEYRIKAPAAYATATFQPSNTFAGLDAGVIYTFEVRDANKCVFEKLHEIKALPVFEISVKSHNNITCSGATDGTAIFTVSGLGNIVRYSYQVDALAPVTALISPAVGNSFDISVTGLSAGTHKIVVTNTDTTCSKDQTVVIDGPTAKLDLNPELVTDVTCDKKGTATINAVGGWGTYEYTITPTSPAGTAITQPTNVFSNLNAGTYDVLVKDLNGCEVKGDFVIGTVAPPTASIDATTDLCAGGTGATIVVSPNAAPNYAYSLNGGKPQNNGTFTGLIPDDYVVTVKDISTGCSIDLPKQVVAIPVVVTDHKVIKKLDCNTSADAIIEVTIGNGYPDYKYRVNVNGAGFPATYTNVGAGVTTFTYPAAVAGTYVFEILDSKGCKTGFTENVATKVTPDFTTDIIDVKCFGDATGKITVTATPASGTYEYSKDNGATWQSSNEFLGLSASTYDIVVRDTNTKCSVSKPITVKGPVAIFEADAQVTTDLKCGTNNASQAAIITVTASGGTPYTGANKYKYTYDTGNPATSISLSNSNTFTINASGTVNITVTDANGCTVATSATVVPLTPPTAIAFSSPAITCEATKLTTDLLVTVTGGKLPLKYEITSYVAAVAPAVQVTTQNFNSYTFTGLVPGTYNFTITDDNGCTKKGTAVIDPVTPILESGRIDANVSCKDLSDGRLVFTISGNTNGTTGYTYSLVGAVTGTITTGISKTGDVITYSGLKADSYTFSVTNNLTKCEAHETIVLTNPTAVTIVSATGPKVFCDRKNTTITVTANGGTGILYYAVVKAGSTAPIYPADYTTSTTFSKDTDVDGLDYDVYVRDEKGCPAQTTAHITKDAVPTIDDPAVTCFKTGGAPITVTISGTTYNGVVQYGIDGVYDNNPVKTISAPGDYILSVKDDNGCEAKKPLHVNSQLTLTVTPEKDVTCSATLPATPDAKITLTAAGGNSTYTYEYKKGASGTYTAILPAGTNVFYTSDPGDYYFKVKSDGCEAESTVPVEVTTPIIPVASAVATPTLCSGSNEGTIKITVTSGGTPPFYYTIDNWVTENQTGYFTDLAGATGTGLEYTYQVRDSKGCLSAASTKVAVVSPDPVTFDTEQKNIECDKTVGGSGSSFGSITVKNVSGGSGSYVYYLTSNFGYSASFNAPTGEDKTFEIIDFGIYTVVVKDLNDCTLPKQVVMASPPEDLDIDVSTTASDCVNAGTAIVTVKVIVPSADYEFGLLEYNYAPYTNNYSGPDVAGGTVKTFKNLIPGVTYTFVVHDKATNCYFLKSANGPIPPASSLVGPAIATNVTCKNANDGSVSFTVSGWAPTTTDVRYQIFKEQSNVPVSGEINVSVSGTSFTRTYPDPLPGTLAPGRYYIAYTEYNGAVKGCQSSSGTFEIKESTTDLEVKASVIKNDNCKDLAGIVKAQASGGTGPYFYQIVPDVLPLGFGAEDTKPTAASFTAAHTASTFYVNSGDYLVWAKDSYGCIQPTGVSVNVPLDPAPAIANLAIVNKCAAEGAFEVTVSMTTQGIAPYYIKVNNADFIEIKDAVPFPYTIKGLSSGPVNVTIKDSNDCSDSKSITITETPIASAQVTKQLDCSVSGNAVANATITVKVEKGTPAYTYEVKKGAAGAYASITPTTTVVAGVTTFTYPVTAANADVYQFRITDANGCPIETAPVNVDAIVPIVPDYKAIQPLCNGGDGTIEVSAKGGKAPYKYNFNGLGFSDTTLYTVKAGTYSFIVKDALGCEVTSSATLGEPTLLTLLAPDITGLTCGAGNVAQSATVVLKATGGTGAYTYSFNGGDFIAKDTYTVTENSTKTDQHILYAIKDANGCTVNGSVDILKLVPPTGFDFKAGPVITCTTLDTNVEIINVAGGVGPLTYQKISPTFEDNGTNIFAGLLPDVEYVFQVTDANKCTFQKNLKIPNVVKIDIKETSKDGITCLTATNGKATFYVSGFNTTYRYTLDGVGVPGNHSNPVISLTGLSAGDHTIEVIDDATDCSKDIKVNIAAPPAALVLATPVVTPLGCTTSGAVTVTASGGWGDYTFTLTQPDNTTITNNNGIFKNLTQTGFYDIKVKDANTCSVEVLNSFELITPPKPTLTIATTSDYCYYNTDSTTLVITAASTSTFPITYEYSIDNGETWHSTFTFDKLTPKTYVIKVRDNYGCESAATTVEIKPQLFASIAMEKPIYCAGALPADGTIRVKAVGGYAPYRYTYTYKGVTSALTNFTNALYSDFNVADTDYGVYVFDVYDARDCHVTTNTVDMVAPTPVTFKVTPTSPNCSDPQGNISNGSILITLDPGNDDRDYTYTIQRTLPTGGALISQNTPLFTGLIAGTYTVAVISGKYCSASTPQIIDVPTAVVAKATPSAFTCSGTNMPNSTVVEVTATGGTGIYTYSENGTNWIPDNKFTVSNDTAQTLTFYVKDSNGCIDDVQIPIAAFPKLTGAVASLGDRASCANNGHETIHVEIAGGASPASFEYQVYQDGQILGTVVQVNPGDSSFDYIAPTAGHFYQFKITDKRTYCSIITNAYNVPVYETAKVIATASKSVSCNGGTNGEITIDVLDYKGNYTYQVWNAGVAVTGVLGPIDSATTNPYTIPVGVGAGSAYTVVIKEDDYPFCSVTSNTFEITQPPVLDLINFNPGKKNQNCNTAGAVITIDETQIVGGSGGYKYVVVLPTAGVPADGLFKDDKIFTIPTTAIAPASDTWNVYVMDANGCKAFVPVNISKDPMPAITNVSVVSPCYDDVNGYTINVSATGVAPLEYSLDGSEYGKDAFFTVKNSGDYTVWVRDANKCVVKAATAFNIPAPLTLKAEVTTDPTCMTATGVVTLTAGGGKMPAQYVYTKDNWITTSVDNVFKDLAPGSYTFIVRDISTSPTCEKSVDVTIETPTLVTGITAKGFDVTCNTYKDGRIEVKLDAANNNPEYRYSLTAGPEVRGPQDSPYFYDLPAGDYEVTVISGKGCPGTATVKVGEPAPIVVNKPVVTQYLCNVGNTAIDATITVPVSSVSGGSNTYIRYQFIRDGKVVQDDDRNTYTESDYLGGTYEVIVFDSKGCQGGYSSVKIDQYVDIARLDLATTKINCRDAESVQVTAIPTRGTLPALTYTIEGTNGTVYPVTNGLNGLFTGLKVGTYLIKVTNPVTGCGVEKPYIVNEPNTFRLVATNIKDVTCFTDSNGSITLTLVDDIPTPTDEAGPFTYVLTHESGSSVSGNSNGTKVDLSNLAAGKYTFVAQLTGLPYCSVTTNFTIQRPSAALEIKVNSKPISCLSNTDGEIVATATGGWTGDYQYKLDGPVTKPYSAENKFTDLPAGLYTVYVMDANGCEDSDTVRLSIPTPIAINISATPMLTCFDNENGIVTINTVSGGSGNYTYTLHGVLVDGTVITAKGQGSNQFTDLKAGTYYVTANDTWGCTNDSNKVTIDQPEIVKATLSIVRTETCQQVPVIKLTAVGGVPPYYYSADGTNYTGPFSSYIDITLPVTTAATEYKYFVKDSKDCRSFVSNTTEFKPVPKLEFERSSKIDIKCKGGATGSITVVAKGGLGNYIYTLQDAAGIDITPAPAQTIPGTFTELPIGTYKVKVTSSDCQTVSTTFVLTEPATSLTADAIATPLTCNGYNNGKITVNAQGGVGAYKYAIEPEFKQFFDKNVFENLKPGFYDILVQDENECYVYIKDVEVKEPDPIVITEDLTLREEEHCTGEKNAKFVIDVIGGTKPYSYSLDNQNGPFTLGDSTQTRFTFSGLEGKAHTVYILDANQCMQEITINMAPPVTLNPTVEVTYDCVNNAQANMVVVTIDPSNTDPTLVTYALDNGNFQPSNIFTNVAAGPHYITVKHVNTCEVTTDLFEVNAVDPVSLIDVTNQSKDINTIVVKAAGGVAPYEYSFNGEPFTSSNSYRIYKTGDYVVIVRDKNGCEATITVHGTFYDFCMPNYFTPNGSTGTTIGPDCGALAYKELTFDIYDRYGRVVAKYRVGGKWDGRYHGQELPTGDYWYVLKLNDPKDPREFVGHFTLYR
ncbi:T9SS type B sorting domain-containing protein [Flavobacterium tistrianum]|uniref:T9SS type B sorting domain-containing protein n=1 Tax=Flavobacterium tistrianum TaxID=1685414 RepID=UPI0013A62FA1|nr:T9SS type B sorting domain-containing protein [Flavobacterium tistrianum]KAF2339262.1 T9SS type B sorting domain-containing protein [Flavobacterium tistrianum]